MQCNDGGCREVQLVRNELQDIWLEVNGLKSSVSNLQQDAIRSEERITALNAVFESLKELISATSDRTDKQLQNINSEIKAISEKVHKTEAKLGFSITWKEILSLGISLVAAMWAMTNIISKFGG